MLARIALEVAVFVAPDETASTTLPNAHTKAAAPAAPADRRHAIRRVDLLALVARYRWLRTFSITDATRYVQAPRNHRVCHHSHENVRRTVLVLMAHQSLRVLVGSLAPGVLPSTQPAKMPAGTIMLDLGPEHPSHAGLIELRLWTEGGVITTARVVVGAMHRGAEKLFEVRDYRQILMLADRHDWQAPFFGELAVAMACEQMMGLAIPDRAVWLRTLLAEHTRILSHCGFLGYVSHRLSADAGLRGLREQLRTQTLRLTGNRIHPMATRVGGLGVDADAAWLRAEQQLAEQTAAAADAVLTMIDSVEFTALTSGVALLDRNTIQQFGVSGPAARASGVDLDLRRQRPYLAYPELGGLIAPPLRRSGDAQSRLALLAQELTISASLIIACIERLWDLPGPVSVRLGKIIRVPEGEAYLAVEAPLGIAGVFLVSRGEKTPWRLKLRTPSFNNISSLEQLLVGVPTDALEASLASIGYVVGDIDK
ncbi:MAG TPA: NADH-quinone oxidoreductase subunit D [Propionibacteriaceae bacterium]|nr:NADH-quinone oxidoreductase subunit D [Propionibacteriaceae bacterium]